MHKVLFKYLLKPAEYQPFRLVQALLAHWSLWQSCKSQSSYDFREVAQLFFNLL